MTVYVADRFQNFDLVGCYAASVVLAVIAIATLLLTNLFEPREDR
jgi:ABC-type sulfate transport system permease subunit